MGVKWIQNFSYNGISVIINAREVEKHHVESYDAINGNPVFSTRLEVPWELTDKAIAALLGRPEKWPYFTVFTNVRCIRANMVDDGGETVTDDERQGLWYHNAFIDVTYTHRIGQYVEDIQYQHVYWEDSMSPRYESLPTDHKQFIWGKDDDEGVPTNKIQLHPDEAPVKPDPGITLTHRIEGYYLPLNDLEDYFGTVHDQEYFSRTLNRKFAAGTLMLRNINTTLGFTFNSHRLQIKPDPIYDPDTENRPDPSGRANVILELVYEYKKEGWKKFYRVDADSQNNGYYYIKYKTDPYDTYVPFPDKNHGKFLSYRHELF